MAQPYIGEIRMFAGNFAPAGWAFCDGQLLPISENETLFVVIGTTYGGDGQTTFALPNLQSRIPLHVGTGTGLSNYQLGEMGGAEEVTLTVQQIPNHTHPPLASDAGGTADSPGNNFWGASSLGKPYVAGPSNTPMNPQSISPTGGSQPHENMMPFLCVNYIISLFGLYPSPT